MGLPLTVPLASYRTTTINILGQQHQRYDSEDITTSAVRGIDCCVASCSTQGRLDVMEMNSLHAYTIISPS